MNKRKRVWFISMIGMLMFSVAASARAETIENVHSLQGIVVPPGDKGALGQSGPTLTDVPDGYYEAAAQQGRLERITYQAQSAGTDETAIEKDAIVYLPYGYDESDVETQYNLFYLMHGGGGSETTYLGSESHPTRLKNMIDHMIEDGVIAPLIVVAPTLYSGGDTSGDTSLVFYDELENDLMPFIDDQYHTYAEDELSAARNHRAFGGFSMGGVTTWSVFINALDHFAYFMPMSGDCWNAGMMGGRNQPGETAQILAGAAIDSGYGQDEYFIFSATGSADMAYENLAPQIAAMQEQSAAFTFAEGGFSSGNLMFYVVEGNGHDYPYSYEYIYNGLRYFFPVG